MSNRFSLEEQRKRLLSKIGGIVELTKQIEKEMENAPHPGGIAYRSLKPKSGMNILHDDLCIHARYQHTDGAWYEIDICKRDSK